MSWEKQLKKFEDTLKQEETARIQKSIRDRREREEARKKYLKEWELTVKTFSPVVKKVCKRFAHIIGGKLSSHPTSLIASKPCLWVDRDKKWNEPEESMPFTFGFCIYGPKDEYGIHDGLDIQIFTCGIDISTHTFTRGLNSRLDSSNFISLDADDFVLHSPSLPAETYYWTWGYISGYDYWRRVHYLIPPSRFSEDLLVELLEKFYRETFNPQATIYKKE
jgi:hypothetical protein